MNLVIDIGNTQYKICVYNQFDIVFHSYLNELSSDKIFKLISEYGITKAIFSDTRGINKKEFLSKFPQNFSILELTHKTPLPINIEYKTPETLGKDRIAGAVAANGLYSDYPSLIIDIGTAITIDFVTEHGVFKGGVISPGPVTRYKSLHDYTGNLPLVNVEEKIELLGNSTITAIQSGVQNGILYEINGYISRFMEEYPTLKIIITGGFAFLFDTKINYRIFADSFIVPNGLNRILIYNERKK